VKAVLAMLVVMLAALDVSAARAQTNVVQDLLIPEAEEIKIGAAISATLRQRYGVVQDDNVHRYVTLVGRALAAESSRPKLPWTFIVLDTAGVNAFAAPGGYVHITRGALAMIRSEAELAGVLAHEITHVTAKHALGEMRRQAGLQLGRQFTSEAIGQLASIGVNVVRSNLWAKPEEDEADRVGVRLADTVGYTPNGLAEFLTKLKARNANRQGTERNGLFSTHNDVDDRLKTIAATIASERLQSEATLRDRYSMNVPPATYQLMELEAVAGQLHDQTKKPAPAGALAVLGTDTKNYLAQAEQMTRPQASATLARNVNVDMDAPGGGNPNERKVTIDLDQLVEFRDEIEA
jgi:predicted Zn-dependent protease